MPVDLAPLQSATRVLFAIALEPVQGKRFQPTGFPNLGAATYGNSLLLESAQSMANRLETTIWDAAENRPIDVAAGISHVVVKRKDGTFLTDTMIESHRLNSPYVLENSDKTFIDELKQQLGAMEQGPINRKALARALLKYDVGSLIHGVFLAKQDLAGGRLRVARALSAFVEADDVVVAASGGVKNDHVNPQGDTKAGFGNVPFARDEFTGDITLYANLDLSQIRGYGLGKAAEELLVVLALFKLRALLDGDMRFRTACDLKVKDDAKHIMASRPEGFLLPPRADLEDALRRAIASCRDQMTVTEVVNADALRKAKQSTTAEPTTGADQADDDEGAR